MLSSAVFMAFLSLTAGSCPFLAGKSGRGLRNPHERRTTSATPQARRLSLGFSVAAVKEDIERILTNETADFGHYGGFMIRLAKNCAGTYRTEEGRGGCDGARIRFEPENSWEDNAGLNEMLDLLRPIKAKHEGLSWGDLIVLAGSTAIESMGGPRISFCGGRTDDVDGSESLPLENAAPGKNHLIYVDAGNATGQNVRDAFTKMGFGDKETVALVAGGHTFGKCHSSRSGFEGQWTHTPTQWSNSYLQNLLNLDWELVHSPGGNDKKQFNHSSGLMMLVADLAMKEDPIYRFFMEEYLNNGDLLKADFGRAWEKLVNRDMGNRPCLSEEVPAPSQNVDWAEPQVKKAVKAMLHNDQRTTDFNHYGPLLVRFAWHCAGTFRGTDYRGGCDGARILHAPQKDWANNDGLVVGDDEPQEELAKALLQPIKDRFGPGLSWGDLIILAGSAALEDMGGREVRICPGRSDETPQEAAVGSMYLDPEIYLDPEHATASELKEEMSIMNFSAREMTVLIGGGHGIGKAHKSKSGFEGPWTHTPTIFSNGFFRDLLDNEWVETRSPMNKTQFTDKATGTLMMMHTDMAFKSDPEFRKFAQEYKEDNDLFLRDFAAAWEKLINADRFSCLLA